MDHRIGLCTLVVVLASSLFWLLLAVGIVPGSVQAYHGRFVVVQAATTVGPQATSTKGQPAQQGKTAQNEQVPSWVIFPRDAQRAKLKEIFTI